MKHTTQQLFLACLLFLVLFSNAFSQKKPYGFASAIKGFNTYSLNYDKINFLYADTLNKIKINDSIHFDGFNVTSRTGFDLQFGTKNNMIINFGMSFSIPLLDRIHMNQYTMGVGYGINIKDKVMIIPAILLEYNKFYYNFDKYRGKPGENLFINGVNIGNETDIRYAKSNYGITPKMSVYWLSHKDKEFEGFLIGADVCYNHIISQKERVEFRDKNFSTGKVWSDILLLILRNTAAIKGKTGDYLYSNNKKVDTKILSSKNWYIDLKIGLCF